MVETELEKAALLYETAKSQGPCSPKLGLRTGINSEFFSSSAMCVVCTGPAVTTGTPLTTEPTRAPAAPTDTTATTKTGAAKKRYDTIVGGTSQRTAEAEEAGLDLDKLAPEATRNHDRRVRVARLGRAQRQRRRGEGERVPPHARRRRGHERRHACEHRAAHTPDARACTQRAKAARAHRKGPWKGGLA